jgi:hypothetical protein
MQNGHFFALDRVGVAPADDELHAKQGKPNNRNPLKKARRSDGRASVLRAIFSDAGLVDRIYAYLEDIECQIESGRSDGLLVKCIIALGMWFESLAVMREMETLGWMRSRKATKLSRLERTISVDGRGGRSEPRAKLPLQDITGVSAELKMLR